MNDKKPNLLMIYDYEMPPHQIRIAHSSAFLLEQALKEYFNVFRINEISPQEVDLVFNTLPITTKGGAGEDIFTRGKMTAFWTPSPLEGIGEQYFKDCDIIFHAIPSWHVKHPKESVILLDATDPMYHEYPVEKKYDIGFLGSEIEATRINLLNKIDEKYNLLRGSMSLGTESAKALSACKLVLSIQDWDWHNAGIERRIFTFGNVRPILIRDNKDYRYIGEPYIDYIPYKSDEECLHQINYYLEHSEEAEKIGNNLKEKLKSHTFADRAKTIHNTYLERKK